MWRCTAAAHVWLPRLTLCCGTHLCCCWRLLRLVSDAVLLAHHHLLLALSTAAGDYCDSFLTHDSPAVRKQHNTGYKHKSNVKAYYLQVGVYVGVG